MPMVSTGKPGMWSDSSTGTVLSGDCAAGDWNGPNPSEEKRNDICLQPSPLSALTNKNLFFWPRALVLPERDRTHGTSCAPPASAELGALSRFSHSQECWKQERQTECAITTSAKEANILLPAPFSHIHSSKMIGLPLVYRHLSVWLVRYGCRPKLAGGGEQSSLPVGGDNLRCWYIALVF